MDVVLAIIVLGAVIFFGALISAGNERQRQALDGIREQAALWAMQDLRLKREQLAREVTVDDPVAWFNQVVARAYGENLDITVSEVFDDPQALVCVAMDGRQVVLAPVSLSNIHRMRREHRGKASRIGNPHPLMKLSRAIEPVEVSILNGGVVFDQELQKAWGQITGRKLIREDKLLIYIY